VKTATKSCKFLEQLNKHHVLKGCGQCYLWRQNTSYRFIILWHVDPLLGNSESGNVFSAWCAPMATNAAMDSVTEERCFPRDPCGDILSRTISES
jgi:hypothetical protein